jgi:thiol-disulfide isomerase/thioredoxin
MKFKAIPAIILFILCIMSNLNAQNIELPLTYHFGYGHLNPSFGGISPYSDDETNPWFKTYLKTSGAPENWTDIKYGDIETNIYQTVYQSYLVGNITNERYKVLQESWDWKPDTLALSKEPLKCKIAFVYGKDSTGEVKMIVDANNNLDFSDDKAFTPVVLEPGKSMDSDSLANTNSIIVSFETFSNNKKAVTSAPILIVYMSSIEMYMNNFPQYATTSLGGKEIAVCSDAFTSLTYESPSIVIVSDSMKEGEKVKYDDIISKNEYLEINGAAYKNIGVNRKNNTLILEKLKLPKNELYSTQIGYKSFPFTGIDFKTNSTISSDNLKGKYVLLDFWSVYCGPCRAEIPTIKELYDKVDRSKFEIVSIVCDSPNETLDELIKKFAITWPQIISNESNKIKETFSVRGYPTTLLLNPEGVIIAKNLRGEELGEKANSLNIMKELTKESNK